VVTIELKKDVALVLFEFLARHDEMDNDSPISELRAEDPAELLALWEVHGALEGKLVEPFLKDFKALVDAARTSVRTRWGQD
jgi:hypothetical protein